ncbi:MAG: HlyD family efflux transporter periplasmic adaptor subunit [Spirulina sp.]
MIPFKNNGGNKQVALLKNSQISEKKPVEQNSRELAPPFDRPVILRQSPLWAQAIVGAIVATTAIAIVWACVAEIEEAVSATGKLEPRGAVQAVQAPVGGVVKTIYIEEGERVEAGELLIAFDTTAARAELESLGQIREKLVRENEFYRQQMNGSTGETPDELPKFVSLTKNRASLLTEIQFYRATLGQNLSNANLSPSQKARFRASQAEFRSRLAASRLQVEQLSKQYQQVQVQLANAKKRLEVDRQILEDIQPLAEEGGLPKLQLLRQEQQTSDREAEVTRLFQEAQRVDLAIAQARERLDNTVALTRAEIFDRIADNQKRIAEIDSQLTKTIVENEKRLEEIDSQLSQTQLTLQYQELKAPVAGTIFELRTKGIGFVANKSEPILKIVPDDNLVARVFITNRDIGFVDEGMSVDVRIDSFPYSEFGDVKGTIAQMGSDVLSPDQIYPFYRFPADIDLDEQFILINKREIRLQSGMSVSANIKVRKRRVISLFTDLFFRKIDTLKST